MPKFICVAATQDEPIFKLPYLLNLPPAIWSGLPLFSSALAFCVEGQFENKQAIYNEICLSISKCWNNSTHRKTVESIFYPSV